MAQKAAGQQAARWAVLWVADSADEAEGDAWAAWRADHLVGVAAGVRAVAAAARRAEEEWAGRGVGGLEVGVMVAEGADRAAETVAATWVEASVKVVPLAATSAAVQAVEGKVAEPPAARVHLAAKVEACVAAAAARARAAVRRAAAVGAAVAMAVVEKATVAMEVAVAAPEALVAVSLAAAAALMAMAAPVARGSSAAQAAGQVVVADREGAESPNRHSRVRGKATLRRVCCRLSAACESP